MSANCLRVLSILCLSAFFIAVPIQAQNNAPDAPSAQSAQTQGSDHVVEGTVVSTTRHTLVVRTDDNQYHLFTYGDGAAPNETIKPGARVRVSGSAPDNNGTQVATNVALIRSGGNAASGGTAAQAAPPPPEMSHVANEIESDTRRWHAGGRIGFGFSPELFMFGVQSQIGPMFSRRFVLRPNLEFGFGELTDMYAINLEGAYRFNTTLHGRWTPYFGMGPSLNFIHQGTDAGNVSFSNFDYKTGFNVFVGGQRRKTFVEMKTSLWSGEAPVLRLFVGYNF